MKIGVLFNCQSDGLTRSLGFLLPQHEVVGFELAALQRNEAAAKAARTVLDGCDMTLSIPLGAKFGALSNDAIRASGHRLVLLPPVSFSGFHPDTVYVIGPDAGHRPGPTGAYHSRLVIVAHLGKLGLDEAVDLFNSLVFARLDYYSTFERDRELLCGQFARFGIDISEYFKAWAASGCFMYSLNHPKIQVLQDLARIACRLLGLEPVREPLPTMTDILGTYPRHPVLEPLARRLGLRAEETFVPRIRPKLGRDPLRLREFVAESYQAYESIERHVLLNVDRVRAAATRLAISIDEGLPQPMETRQS